MAAVIATYDYQYGNNAWHYQLFSNRIVAAGHTGPQRHEQIFELQFYFEHPNRSISIERKQRRGIALLAASMFFLIGLVATIALDVENVVDAGVATGIVGGFFGLSFPVYYLVLAASRRQQLLTVVHFKRHDNRDGFVVWLIGEENREAFDNFIAKTRSVIRSLHIPS